MMKSSPACPETLPLMIAPGVKSWTSSPCTSFDKSSPHRRRGGYRSVDFVIDIAKGVNQIEIDHKNKPGEVGRACVRSYEMKMPWRRRTNGSSIVHPPPELREYRAGGVFKHCPWLGFQGSGRSAYASDFSPCSNKYDRDCPIVRVVQVRLIFPRFAHVPYPISGDTQRARGTISVLSSRITMYHVHSGTSQRWNSRAIWNCVDYLLRLEVGRRRKVEDEPSVARSRGSRMKPVEVVLEV